jgi:hypothetical protein
VGTPRLKHDLVADLDAGDVVVRYPSSDLETARAAVEVVRALWPVVEAYLGAAWHGRLRVDLLAEARASGANPAAATLRHSVRGVRQRSPTTAGVLSYQLGQVLWYAATNEAAYRGTEPRAPDWLITAGLTPLMHAWAERDTWSDHLAQHVQRAVRRPPLPEEALARHADLRPSTLALAVSQSLARGRSLVQRHPGWVRDLRAQLAAEPQWCAWRALAAVTGADAATWRERFALDLAAWRGDDDEWRPGVVT